MSDLPYFVLDPTAHQGDTASKIVFALERLSHLFRIHWWEQNKETGLSPLQMQILIALRFQPQLHAVSAIARYLELTEATVSDAVRVLHQKAYLEKRPYPEDARRHILSLTPSGTQMAERLALFANQVQAFASTLPHQGEVLESLLLLMTTLQQNGFIPWQQMCTTCRHFQRVVNGLQPYYCRLLDQPLAVYDLRVHCPEHEAEGWRGA